MCDILQVQGMLQVGIALPVAYLALPRLRVRERIRSEFERISTDLQKAGIWDSAKEESRGKTIVRIGKGRSAAREWRNPRLGNIYNKYYRDERERRLMVAMLKFSLPLYLAPFLLWQFDICPTRNSFLGWVSYLASTLSIIIPSLVGYIGRECFINAVKSMEHERDVLIEQTPEEQRNIGLERAAESSESLDAKFSSEL